MVKQSLSYQIIKSYDKKTDLTNYLDTQTCITIIQNNIIPDYQNPFSFNDVLLVIDKFNCNIAKNYFRKLGNLYLIELKFNKSFTSSNYDNLVNEIDKFNKAVDLYGDFIDWILKLRRKYFKIIGGKGYSNKQLKRFDKLVKFSEKCPDEVKKLSFFNAMHFQLKCYLDEVAKDRVLFGVISLLIVVYNLKFLNFLTILVLYFNSLQILKVITRYNDLTNIKTDRGYPDFISEIELKFREKVEGRINFIDNKLPIK